MSLIIKKNTTFKIPRTPPFLPSSLGGLALWLKPDAGLNFNGSDEVTEWTDQSSAGNNFSQDLDNLIQECEDSGIDPKTIFVVSKGQHPYIIKAFLRKTISLETLVILEKIRPYLDTFDSEIQDKIMWPDISRLIRKYKPFLKFDKERFYAIFRRRVGHNNTEDSNS